MRSKISQSAGLVLAVFIFAAMVINVYGIPGTAFKGKNDEGSLYAVGFKTLELFDHSRTAREKYDYFGNLIDRETARPIQICIWYPAESPPDDLPMVFSEYNFPYPGDDRFIDYISEIQNREVAYLQRILQGDQAMVLDILNNEVGAVRDAAPPEGQFPLILYLPDAGHGISENFGLLEYLAANGYVVAAVHSIGTYQPNPATNPLDLETITRDAEFAISFLKSLPEVDENELGLIGYGFGADVSVLLKMRNYNIKALLCLDNARTGYDRIGLLKSNPYFDPPRVNVPVLYITGENGSVADAGILDSLEFATKYLLSFSPDSGLCFTEYDKFIAMKLNQSGELSPLNIASRRAVNFYTLNFFKAYLEKDEKAKSHLIADPADNSLDPGLLRVTYSPGKQAPPNEFQFLSIINNQGIDTAVELYRKFKPDYPGHVFFQEGAFNVMGYRFLQSGRLPEALIIFELNADAFPSSANVWDSYGEACLAAGEYQKALESYQKALEILPDDSTTPEALKTAIENGAPQQIQRIEELIKQSESEEN